MRIALYLRISTIGQTHEPQRIELLDYCARRGWGEPKEYADTISGAKFTRTGLDRLMRDVRAKKLDVIVAVKLDRLGRSLSHLATLIAELDKHKVALICTSQGIDTSADNAAGRLQMHVLAAVAEFERSLIRERTLAGLAAARARGSILGRRPRATEAIDGDKSLVAACLARSPRPTQREIAAELGMSTGKVCSLAKLIAANAAVAPANAA